MNTKNIFLNIDNEDTQVYCKNLHEALSKDMWYDKLIDIIQDTVQGDGIQELIKHIQTHLTQRDENTMLHIRETIYEHISDEEIIQQIIHRFYDTQDVYEIMVQVENQFGIQDARYSFLRNTKYTSLTQTKVFNMFVRDILDALRKPTQTERLVYVKAAQKWLTANLLNTQIEYL